MQITLIQYLASKYKVQLTIYLCTSRTTHQTTELLSSLTYSLNQPLSIDYPSKTDNSAFQMFSQTISVGQSRK